LAGTMLIDCAGNACFEGPKEAGSWGWTANGGNGLKIGIMGLQIDSQSNLHPRFSLFPPSMLFEMTNLRSGCMMVNSARELAIPSRHMRGESEAREEART